MRKPKIGIAANIEIVEGGVMPGLYRSYVNQDYIVSLEKAGCISFLLPPGDGTEDVREQLECMDGVLLSGGYDIDPALYGEQPRPGLGFVMAEVDRFYMEVIRAADEMGKPVLGICKGIQALNVAFGGTLYQDMESQKPGVFMHVQKAPRYNPSHEITVEPDSFIGAIRPRRIMVNSFHHQGIREAAEEFRVTASAADGIPECIEKKSGTFMCGVQWHPEMMAAFGNGQMLEIFRRFGELCRDGRPEK